MELLGTISSLIFCVFSHVNLTFALASILIAILWWHLSFPKGIPPGPFVVPIVGYLASMGGNPHEKFSELAKKYGPVFSLYFGNRLVVVLNNYESIKEALANQGDTFAGRPSMHLQIVENDRFSVATSDGEIWRTHRRFALNVLRDLGVGKLSIEPLIMDEIQHFLLELKKRNGKTSNFSDLLNLSVSNNICILIFGRRFEYEDPWFNLMAQYFNDAVMVQSATSIFTYFPWMLKLPKVDWLFKRENLMRSRKMFKDSLYTKIRERRKCYEDGRRDCYLNACLGEQKSRNSKDTKDDMFSDRAIEENIGVFLAAGTETTANTLMWCIVYMVANSEVQKKVQQEIDDVIGMDRTPCFNDKLRMPYTEATILEVQRIATLVPTNIPHRNVKNTEIFGYKIPKDTFIITNLWAVHNDTNLWKDPEVFRPERFLSSSGELVKKEFLIPFSLGKRECMGISLAKMELFLYFTSMLQKFTFKSADGSPPSFEPRMGFTVAPKYFEIRSVRRNS